MPGQSNMQGRPNPNGEQQQQISGNTSDTRQSEPMGPAKKRLIPQELLQGSLPVHRPSESQHMNSHSMEVSANVERHFPQNIRLIDNFSFFQ